MLQRQIIFLVVCLTMFYGNIIGQKNPEKDITVPQNSFFQANQGFTKIGRYLYQDISTPVKNWKLDINGRLVGGFSIISPLSPNFYTCNLTFFCRNEMMLQKKTTISWRFRLGSTDYVDYLEQKPGALKR